jgi:septum formation protein
MVIRFVHLASGSPRRRELLQQLGVPYQLVAAEVDESTRAGEAAPDYVSRLAGAKAQAGWASTGGPAVLGADTAVVLDHEILGKPRDRGHGVDMLQRLSGRRHAVLTAVALCTAAGVTLRVSASEVAFRRIPPEECLAYWETGEPLGKAGAYAIQGLGAVFVADLRGSFSGVMGLPLFETAELLDAAGVPRWRRS